MEAATRARNPNDMIIFSPVLATVEYYGGNLAGWELHTERAAGLAKGEPDQRVQWHRYGLAFVQGALQEARSRLAAGTAMSLRFNRAVVPLVIYAAPMAALEQRLGNAEGADNAYRQAVVGVNSMRGEAASRLTWAGLVGLLASARGDHPVMDRCEGVLSRYPDLLANAVGTAPDPTCVRRVLGAITAATARWEEAVDHLERGLAFCQEKGLAVELAHCRLALADVLMRRNPASGQALEPPPEDRALRQRATGLVDQALNDFQRMGMTLYAQDALSRREIIKA